MSEGSRAKVRHKKALGTAKRLALREYLPLGSWILSWFMIGLAVGHADAVRLLTANTFVQAIRHVCTVEGMQVLARRMGADVAVFKLARRTAFRIEVGSLIASIVATALLYMLLDGRRLHEMATMVAIVALAIPARNPTALVVTTRERVATWRLGSAMTFAAGSGLVLLFGLHWAAAAAVLAMRDWGGLLATLLFAPPRKRVGNISTEPLTFAEAARRTESSARQKLSYRLISSVASLALGPFGNLAARTGREIGKVDSRLAKLVPRKKPGFILFTLGTTVTAIALLFVSREPATLLASAAAARLAASGAAVLLWWRYAAGVAEEDELDED